MIGMKRRLALVCATVLALTGHSMAADKALSGVWTGTVGKFPVMACFDTQTEYSRAAYYYLSQKKIITLSQSGNSSDWQEAAAGDNKLTARWGGLKVHGVTLTGLWQNASKRLPIVLSRVDLSHDEAEMPCGVAEFQAARATPITVTESQAALDGTAYTKLVADVGQQFDVSLSSFALAGDSDGIRKVNAQLRETIPTKTQGSDFLDCMMGSVASNGMDGSYTNDSVPSLILRDFLVVKWSAGSSCGGAHPNYGEGYDVYDLQSGEKLDVATWFDMAKALPVVKQVVQARVTDGSVEKDCGEAILENDYWTYGVSREGLLFLPDLPHAMQACATEFTVPFAQAEGLLSEAGKDVVGRFRRE